jgi:hypothetical protein
VTLHRNARTCPRSRKLLVDRVICDGWSIREAAAARASASDRRLSALRRSWPCASCASPQPRSPRRWGWRTRPSRRSSSATAGDGYRAQMLTGPRTATSARGRASSCTSMSKSSGGSPASGIASPATGAWSAAMHATPAGSRARLRRRLHALGLCRGARVRAHRRGLRLPRARRRLVCQPWHRRRACHDRQRSRLPVARAPRRLSRDCPTFCV